MSLGYALLHPHKVEAAISAGREKRTIDVALDMLCGALGIQGVDAELEAAFAAQSEAFTAFGAQISTLFEPGRPLEQFKLFAEFDISNPAAAANAFDYLCAFLENAEPLQVKGIALPIVDAVLDVLPNLDTQVAAGFATKRLDDIVGILKAPLRQGRKDVAAIKAYRAAMTLRCLLNPVYAKFEALGQVDLRAILRATIVALLDGLDGLDFAPLRSFIGRFKGEFGGLLQAILCVAGGGSVSAGVQTMPDEILTIFDDIRAAPHKLDNGGGALWWTDLITNVLILFNLIWEVNRTRPFKDGRGGDAFLLFLGIAWHILRTLMRAFGQDIINRPPEGEDASVGKNFVNFLFTDWGDLAVHMFLRFLIPLIYEVTDGATNWALMMLPRMMLYFANTFNFRIWYQWARTLWYYDAFKELQQTLDASEITEGIDLHKMSFGRMIMGIVPLVWFVCGFTGGVIMPWDGFEVENWDVEYVVFVIIAVVIWFASHGWISFASGVGGYNSITLAALPDLPVLIMTLVGIAVMLPPLLITILGLESDAQDLALGFAIGVPVVLGVLLLVLGIYWATSDTTLTNETSGQAFFSQFFSCVITIVMGLLGGVIWWFIIDDGRDKEEVYDGLDVDQTPYLLPFRRDENWFCGQSFHGVFSHLFSSASSHYAVDMNEAPGKSGLATRAGVVVDVTQGNPDNEDTQNDVILMHTAWAPNADPGDDNERVLTYSDFVHTQENGVHARIGQFVPQGMHLTDIDSTGRSAVHHTHFSAQTGQRGFVNDNGSRILEGLPFIFRDPSLRDFRNYPLLAWVPGKGQIQGKPLSFAFYVSDNAETPPHPHAVTVPTAAATIALAGGPVAHSHRILIDRSLLTGGAVSDPLVLRTTVVAGHFHTVTLAAADLERLFRMQAPEGVSTSTDFGHAHTIGMPLIFERVRLRTTDVTARIDGADIDHAHTLDLGIDFRTRNSVPAGGLTFTFDATDDHDHDITLTSDQLDAFMARGDADVSTGTAANVTAGIAVAPHTHDTVRATGINNVARNMTTRITDPPAGMLTARIPGPYDVLGERMIVRVNDRSTEWFFWGGVRARTMAEIAVDYGFGGGDQISIGVGGTVVAPPAPRRSMRDTAAAVSQALRVPAGAFDAPPRRAVMRAEPVLVIETRQAGSGAQLVFNPLGSAPIARLPVATPPGTASIGSGPFPDLAAVNRDDFLAHVTDLVQNGWPSPSSPVTATVPAQRLQVLYGPNPADFATSGARIADVATGLYDATALEFRASGPIPLVPGRMALAADFGLPLLATPARVAVPVPAAGEVVSVVVNLAAVGINVVADADGDRTARIVMQQVEGVRAWTDTGMLVIETLSAGPDAALSATVGATAAVTGAGAAPAGLAFGDLGRITPADLGAAITDATARATPPPGASAANLRITPGGNRLTAEVDAPATLTATVTVTGDNDPIAFTGSPATPQEAVSGVLPATLRFDGPAWIDFTVTDAATETVRIPIDGAPARLDLMPARLPENGETLTLEVNGAPLTVTFDGSERSVADMAERIGAASGAITVRLAYRAAIEDMNWGDAGGDLQLDDTGTATDGLALAGFLAARPVATTARLARGEDMLAQGGIIPNPERRRGEIVNVLDISRETAGPDEVIRASVRGPADRIQVFVDPGPDPLQFPTALTAGSVDSVGLGATVNLGVPALVYHFMAVAPDGTEVANGFAQIAAQPAVARGVTEITLPLPDPAILDITVVEPGQPNDVPRPARVDLSGALSLNTVAQRINSAVPHARAWVARPSEVGHAESTQATDAVGGSGVDLRSFDDRLHIETVGSGTGWRLELGDVQTAAALGMPLSAESGGVLRFAGRGNVSDGRAVDRDRIAEILQEAVESMTGSVNPVGAGPSRVSVQTNGTAIELRSGEGQIDVAFEPPSLGNLIAVDVQPDVTTLNPPPSGGAAASNLLPLDSGRILLRTGGRGLAAVEIFGAPAILTADAPIPVGPDAVVTEQLDLLKAHPITVSINGVNRTLPVVPNAVDNLDDAVAFLSRATDAAAGWDGDDWWIGLRAAPGVPGERRFVIRTRRRGSIARLTLDLRAFPTPFPAAGILGFTQDVTNATGNGNFFDLDAVPIAIGFTTLARRVREAVDRGAARQALYAATADTAGIVVTGSLATTSLAQTTAPGAAPGGVDLQPPGGAAPPAPRLEFAYAGLRPLAPGPMEILTDNTAIADPRIVRALFHAEPARMGPFTLPNSASVLNNTVLALVVDGTLHEITFATDASTSPLDLARQIERGTGWSVQVEFNAGSPAFTIATLRRGSAAVLALSAPASGGNAVTDDTATGLTAPPVPLAAGTGSVGDIDAVTPADYAAVLQVGMAADRDLIDTSTLNGYVAIDGSCYDPPERDLTNGQLPVWPLRREYARILSQRIGCSSSVVPMDLSDGAAIPAVFDFDRSLERAPAVRAAVHIPPISAGPDVTARLSGELHIQFNENNGIPDLPPEQTVIVTVPDGDYTPGALRALIHNTLFDAGIGAAQIYRDGSIMVESLAAGLPGTVRIPGASTPDAERGLADTLVPGGAFARGWPGAGRTFAGDTRRPGYRSRAGAAAGGVQLNFTDGLPPAPAAPGVVIASTAVLSVAAGDSLADIAARLDAQLAAATNPAGTVRRIGFAAVGDDGALYVEGVDATFALTNVFTLNAEPRVGSTPERSVDSALGLRRTDEPRTLRIARDRNGHGVLGEHDDLGWARVPADGPNGGVPGPILQMPPGRYLTLTRSEASKSQDYDAASEMIVRAGADPADASRVVALQARHWIGWDDSSILGVAPGPDGLVMVLLERQVR